MCRAWILGILSLAASVTHAGAVPDPKILIAGTGYSEILYGPNFGFTSNPTGGGILDFVNASGFDWLQLSINTTIPYGYVDDVWVALDSPQYYDVSSELFADSVLLFGDNSLTIHFFGVDVDHPGIPYAEFFSGNKDQIDPPFGSHFTIGLDNDNTPGVGGWLGPDHGPLTFGASANPAPEPATGALLLGGLVALGICLRRSKSPAR